MKSTGVKDDLPAARYAVSMIVGRVRHLDMTGVTKAAVETVAENTTGRCPAAPFIWLSAGRSSAGSTSGQYHGFPWWDIRTTNIFILEGRRQKLDDLTNFIPARLCAWVAIFTPSICHQKDHEFDGSHAKRSFKGPFQPREPKFRPDGIGLRQITPRIRLAGPGISENL